MAAHSASPSKLYLLQLSASTLPLSGHRTLELICAAYLIETHDGKHILIDSGLPSDFPRPAGAPPSRENKSVLEHLEALRLRPPDISTVISTHFDVDHAGYHDSFPTAEFIVQREHYHLARGGHARFAAARSHWDHPALRYRLVDGDTELLPGLTLLETNGHCSGHQSVLVDLPRTGAVLLAIDAVMMQSQFGLDRKPWPQDDNPQMLLASTRKLLDLVERKRVSLVFFGHDGLQWQSLKRAPEFYD
ncbi:MAG TPA: N-acyl homoserine lactonase family protein [Candidatus Methylomirabilis sp.]|nr:N-acyl homoserine lactonase family protein [Candidatus Methylomirabilis sp.]